MNLRALYTIVSALLISVSLSAQQVPHITFKGMAVDGTTKEFGSALQSQGFTPYGSDVYTGKFANRESIVTCFGTPKTGTVYKVSAIIYQGNRWEQVSDIYEQMETTLDRIYGERMNGSKKFDYPYRLGDGYEMTAIKEGKARIYSVWESVKDGLFVGTVELNVAPTDKGKARIAITYTDAAGEYCNEKENNEILINDL